MELLEMKPGTFVITKPNNERGYIVDIDSQTQIYAVRLARGYEMFQKKDLDVDPLMEEAI